MSTTSTTTDSTTERTEEQTDLVTQPEKTTEPEPEDTPDDDGKGGKEAAKYRRRLRETETERDALTKRVETLQRGEVERLAGHLSQPSAVWAAGVQLADVLDEQGDVDPEKVRLAVTAASEQLGLARAPRTPRPDPSQGGANSSGPSGPKFSDAFSPGRR